MNNEINDILIAIDELIAFFEKHEEKPWLAWIKQGRDLICAGDLQGVTHILRAYGGMGSIIDLGIHSANGHKVNGDIGDINRQLMVLRAKLYKEAEKIDKLVKTGKIQMNGKLTDKSA